MSRSLAALGGAGAGVAGCLAVAAALDKNTRHDLVEAGATIAVAPAMAVLAPFRGWGAKRVPPEALAGLLRSRFLDNDVPAIEPWVFALTRRTGLVWFREVLRDGRKVRFGSTEDFRRPIRVRDLLGDVEPEGNPS